VYASPNTVSIIKSRGMGRAFSMHGRDVKCIQNFWSEILKTRGHSEGLGTDGRIILEWILGKYSGKVWNIYI
jgi:hypothetical protein